MSRKQEAEAGKQRQEAEDKKSYRSLASDLLRKVGDRLEAGCFGPTIRHTKPIVQRGLEFGSDLVAGGPITNRPPATSESQKRAGQEPLAPATFAEFAGGEDWFEASLWVQWSQWDSLRLSLETAREAAKAQAEGSEVNRADCVVIWNQEYLVHATGSVTGDGGRVYRYRLQKQGVTYLIANCEEPTPEFANVRFVVGSLPLMLEDAETIWRRIQNDLDDLGGEVVKSTLSRVDVCIDLPNVDVAEFEQRWRDGRYITRARESEEYDPAGDEASVHWIGRGARRKCTGIRIGAKGAPMKLNVYDKLHEVTKKRDETKLDALIRYRWGGKCPDCATRVEVQMRREKIKEMTWETRVKGPDGKDIVTLHHVDTVDDWISHRAEVMRYVLFKWLRFTEPFDFENNHHSEAETWELWERIRKAAEAMFAVCVREGAGRLRRLTFGITQLVRQSIGTISSAMVYSRGVLLDKSEFVAEFIEESVREIDSMDWGEMQKRQCKKRSRFEASMPAHCFE